MSINVRIRLGPDTSLDISGDQTVQQIQPLIDGFYKQVDLDVVAATKRIEANTAKVEAATGSIEQATEKLNQTGA